MKDNAIKEATDVIQYKEIKALNKIYVKDKKGNTQNILFDIIVSHKEYKLSDEKEKIGKYIYKVICFMTKLETLYYNSKDAVIDPAYQIRDGKVYVVSNFTDTKLKTIIFGNNVEKIGERAFFGSVDLKDVILSNSVLEIEKQAFYCCINVKTIYLGNKITKIGEEAFSSCSLESITIPENVTSIGTKAFFNCTNLKKLTYNAIECEYDGINGSSALSAKAPCPISLLPGPLNGLTSPTL